jgi:hypothetical protein
MGRIVVVAQRLALLAFAAYFFFFGPGARGEFVALI